MVEAILQAAAETFARHGYARATTNRIAERAGVSVGSLYQYFPNKDSLLAALLEQHHADVHLVIDSALSLLEDPAVTLETGLRQLLNDLVQVHRDNPALTRALSAAVLRESPAVDGDHKETADDARNRRVVTLLASRPDVRAADPVAMAVVLSQTLAQLTRWLVHEAPPAPDPDVLTEEVLQLLLRYLKQV